MCHENRDFRLNREKHIVALASAKTSTQLSSSSGPSGPRTRMFWPLSGPSGPRVAVPFVLGPSAALPPFGHPLATLGPFGPSSGRALCPRALGRVATLRVATLPRALASALISLHYWRKDGSVSNNPQSYMEPYDFFVPLLVNL